mgnify:CR=1 FL=1
MPTARAATRPDGEPKTMTNPTVEQLVARSNRLGADKRNTNFAGGNTAASADPPLGTRAGGGSAAAGTSRARTTDAAASRRQSSDCGCG